MIIALSPAAMERLRVIAEERDEKIETLAENAVEEAALDYFRRRDDDPGRGLSYA